MIVVDTNVIAYFFVDGEHTAAARALRQAEPRWRVPPLWRHEYLNVLATFARAGGADVGAAQVLWRDACILLAGCEQEVDMASALDLAVSEGISAYDAQLVILAQGLGVDLVTGDRRLLERFTAVARPL